MYSEEEEETIHLALCRTSGQGTERNDLSAWSLP